jgi:16S rRNA G1207 methylase RsmC
VYVLIIGASLAKQRHKETRVTNLGNPPFHNGMDLADGFGIEMIPAARKQAILSQILYNMS